LGGVPKPLPSFAKAMEVCRLLAGSYGTTEFDMSEQRMTALIEAGRVAMSKFFC